MCVSRLRADPLQDWQVGVSWEGEPKKARGQRQGSNSSHPLSPLAHIAPILAPFVIPVSLIPVIPATPLISVNLKGEGCSSSIKGQATKIWGENRKNIEFRNPVIMNLEPFHQVSGDMSRDSVTNTRIQFLKS